MCKEHRNFSNLLILLAIGFGLLAGWGATASSLPWIEGTTRTMADLFLRLLKFISLPIIFFSITSTITGMRDFQEMKTMGRRVILYTIGTTIAAAAIALALFCIIEPAQSVSLDAAASVLTQGSQAASEKSSYLTFLVDAVPSNLLQPFLAGNVIGIALIAFAMSIATLFLPENQKNTLHGLFSSFFALLLKITSGILKLMPLAIFAFVTLLFIDLKGSGNLRSLFAYLACVVLANLVQGLILLPLLLKAKKISPLRAVKAMMPALTLAFFSKSSSATLPVAMQSVEKMGVSKRVSSFSLPLCSVINMNGCAAFILITVLFVGKLHGMLFSPLELIGWVFLATLAAIGNAGVPMGCFFLASAFLVGLNLPLYMMGLILPFYTFLDMLETALNIWSDGCVALSVDRDLARDSAKPEIAQ